MTKCDSFPHAVTRSISTCQDQRRQGRVARDESRVWQLRGQRNRDAPRTGPDVHDDGHVRIRPRSHRCPEVEPRLDAGDLGPIINMSGAENQTEGAVIDGFSTAMGLEIGFENGRITQNYMGNEWDVDEFIAEMKKAAEAKPAADSTPSKR